MWAEVYAVIRDFYRRSFWERSSAITEYGAGYILNYSGRRWLSGANQLWLDDPSVLSLALLHHSAAFFRKYWADWSIFILPEVYPELLPRCQHLGLHDIWLNPVMFRPHQASSYQPSRQIKIGPLRGLSQADLAYRIACEVFYIHWEAEQEMFRPEHESDPSYHHYLAFYERHPAGIASLNMVKPYGGLWNVATRKLFQRRGVGRAMLDYVTLHAANLGVEGTLLLASNQGVNLYQQAGYEIIGTAHYMGAPIY